MTAETVAPQNIGAEETVLSALMLAGTDGPEASSVLIAALTATGLEPRDFYRPSHALVYEAALAVNERNEPTHVLILERELRTRHQLTGAGGRKRLQELAALAPAAANAAHFARLIVEESYRREQVEAGLALIGAAEDGGLAANPELRERVARVLEPRRSHTAEIEFVTFEEFVATPEPQAEPLAIDPDGGTVFPATGLMMYYGTGGAGKTTLMLDGAVHFAAGDEWLEGHVRPVRELRVGWIENEGPREEFRRKIERKLAAWKGRVERDRLRVLNRPWSQYDLRRDDHRDALARHVSEANVDLLIIGPLHRLGMEGGGTPDDIRAFTALVEDVQRRAGRPVAFLVIHHENRAGQVSGAWEGVPELLVHVQGQGHGRLRVFWQKARWSSLLHQTALTLTWAEGEGFAVEEKPELDDDAIADKLLAAIAADPGTGWTRVVEQTRGIANPRRKAVRDQLLQARTIVNVAKGEDGEEVLLDHCPERRPARLYPADDPTIRHLRPDPGADGAQAAPAGGEGGHPASAPLRPDLKEGRRGVGADAHPPETDLNDVGESPEKGEG